jgi:type I restriction enzyme R subunit
VSNENITVEQPFIQQLVGMGWTYVAGDPAVPYLTQLDDAPLRNSFKAVLLRERLAAALERINPWLDSRRIEGAITALERVPGHTLMGINEAAQRLLLYGTKVEGDPKLHGGRPQTVHFIDFQHPANNEFLVINQFRVDPPWSTGGRDFCIPDIVLFVNGIPLVVVECKSPYLDGETAPIASAISDLLYYTNQRDDIENNTGVERLFHTNLFMIATSFDEARVGTLGARHKHYLEWKDPAPQTRAELAAALGVPLERLSSQQILVAGMLHPMTLLDLLANFVIFKEDSGRRIKVVARYQQFRAVQKAVHRLLNGKTKRQDGRFDLRGGIIWHTQGSGKSLTMVFLIRRMRRIAHLSGFKIVVITDRTDLQDQLSETAELSGESVQVARSSDDLKRILRESGPGLVFAMIQKYRGEPGIDLEDIGALEKIRLNDSEQILVLVDEAHRSHTNTLHTYLEVALPNCAMIGFTGTPIIMGRKKETTRIFGEFIDTYTIEQAVADGATVKILYEGRTADGMVADEEGLNQRFEQLFHLDDYTPEEREAIKRKYGTLENIAEAQALIAAKARDMLIHYVETVLPNEMKAMIVASSRRAAVRYQAALVEAQAWLVDQLRALPDELKNASLEEIDPEDATTLFFVKAYRLIDRIAALEFAAVISADLKNDDPAWRQWSERHRIDNYIERFRKPMVHPDPEQQSRLAFLCVNSMLLTGFDAPVAQVLYLDRSIREHELLQAVARVNRTYARKSHGLVVDYYGVALYLREALEAYSPEDVQGALFDIEDELPLLQARYHDVLDVFGDHGITDIYAGEEACIFLLKETRIRAEFIVKLGRFLETLDTVLPRAEALPYLSDAKQLERIRIRARNRYRDGMLNLADAGQKIRKLIDEFVLANGINPLIAPISIMDVEGFRQAVAAAVSPRAKASEMEEALRHHITKHTPEDPVYYRRLSEQLNALLEKYHNDWEALATALEQYLEQVQHGHPVQEDGLGQAESPFLRLLADELLGDRPQLTQIERQHLVQLTLETVRQIRQSIVVVDFWKRKTEQDKLRLYIYEYLSNQASNETEANLMELTDKVIALARHNHVILTT